MDWLETLFRVSPDGGSGLTELLVATGAVLAAALWIARRTLPLFLRR